MKLSDISYREYLAAEFVPTFANSMVDREAVWRAFGLADAFLAHIEKEDHTLANEKLRADRWEAQCEMLLNIEPPHTGAKIALTQIWEALGVTNQTAAMESLRDLVQRAYPNREPEQ